MKKLLALFALCVGTAFGQTQYDHRWQIDFGSNTCGSGSACTNGAGIFTVVDQGSGTANNLVQSSNQPTYNTAVINGHAVATLGNPSVLTASTPISSSTFSGMVVFKAGSIGSNQALIGCSASAGCLEWRINGAGHQEILALSVASVVSGAATFTAGTWYTAAFVCDPTSSGACKLYTCTATCTLDGTSSSTASFSSATDTFGAAVANGDYMSSGSQAADFLFSSSLWNSTQLNANAAMLYALYGAVAGAPTFTPGGTGPTYRLPTGGASITIDCPTGGTAPLYSIDGSPPSLTYTVPVSITVDGTVLKSKCTGVGFSDSSVTTVTYSVGSFTWYVRPDGGTRYSSNVPTGQCDGRADVAYPGSGTNQHCAYNDFRYMWDDDSGMVGAGAWVISGGDTVYVRGCHALAAQQNPSNPNCRIGWDIDSGGGPTNLWCQFVGNITCYNPPIPAGTSGAHTKIYGGCVLDGNCNTGTNTNRSNLIQLFGGFGLLDTLNLASTQYLDIRGFEITTHNGTCSVHGSPQYPTGCSASPPISDYADTGILTNNTTSNLLLQDVYVTGFESNGLFGPIGGPVTLTRVNVSFNARAGWQFDDGSSTPDAAGSSITASYLTMNGNGCKQEYPLSHAWPALACWDDVSNGFGDALSGQNTVLDSLICDHCTFLYNTKDSFIGPHTQIQTLTVTNSYSAGNMGSQMKYGTTQNANVLFQNNLFVMNCYRQTTALPGAAHSFNQSSGLGGAYLSDFCRGNDGWAFLTRANSTIHNYGNTVVAAVTTMMDMNCGYVDGSGVHQETNCNTSPLIWKDNNFLGYTDPIVGDQPGLWYFDPGAGGSLVLDASYNNYFGIRNIAPDVCGTNHITCSDPLMVSEPAQAWPGSEAALDVFDPFAGSGNSFYPTSGSPLRGAGTALGGLTTDFYGTARPSPPGLGGVEFVGTPTAATPTFSPVAGTYGSAQSVTISTTRGTVICYTTNGTTPATNGTTGCTTGTLYTAPVSVSSSLTIKAIAGGTGYLDSSVGSAAYVITIPSTGVTTGGSLNVSGTLILQ